MFKLIGTYFKTVMFFKFNNQLLTTFIILTNIFLVISKDTTIKARRSHRDQQTLLPIQERLQKERKRKDVGLFEPYWENGHWVFDRLKEGRIHKQPSNILNVKTTENNECDQICPAVYEEYGKVCAQRFAIGKFERLRWNYQFKEFDNMCYLEYENCRYKKKTWYLLHRGNCPELSSRSTHPTNGNEILKRMTMWMRNVP